ncbi:hypothetical protein G210_4458 [Candida maltosa Xu316]|uniref:Uncharacterized protein n=1 Tax=Candida maltosa (strain Xu316) TaxID=1245528 RepID=M3JRE9_CANMX|nr:hypothetical protein G210_4458 [Candida maltosa Xu316]
MTSLDKLLYLPPKIIQLIFSYVPFPVLEEFKDIPEIRPFVISQLYSSVLIKPPRSKDYQLKLEIPIGNRFNPHSIFTTAVWDVHELVAAISDSTQLQLLTPRKLLIHDINDIFELHRIAPEILQNSEISIYFIHLTRPELAIRELKQLPYTFDGLSWFSFFDELTYGSNREWFDNVKLLEIVSRLDLNKELFTIRDIFTQSEFSNLNSLDVGRITFADIEYIPRYLKKLDCVIDYKSTEHAYKRNFPWSLTSLEVVLEIDEESSFVFDLSYLDNLRNLKFSGWDKGDVILPANLKKYYNISMNLDQVNRDCPNVEELFCATKRESDTLSNFPSNLKVLTVYSYVFENITKTESGTVDLPPCLEKLTIRDNIPRRRDEFDFMLFSETYELNHLRELSILSVDLFEDIGKLPKSITSLTIVESKGINFSDIADLSHLEKLVIDEVPFDQFKFKLPSSLQYLKITNSGCQSFDITAESLRCLVLNRNNLLRLDNTTLKLPPSLIELDLSENSIQEIDKDFTFPTNLETLLLQRNNLTIIFNIPCGLKKLDFSINQMGQSSWYPMFPDTLEELNLSNNSFDSNFDFSILFLTNCPKLKKLDVSVHKSLAGFSFINNLNLNDFPKSLTHFYLANLGIKNVIGSFSEFGDLEELDMRGNYSVGIPDPTVDSLSLNYRGGFFGRRIKYLWITGGNLPVSTVETIRNNVHDDSKRWMKKKEKNDTKM